MTTGPATPDAQRGHSRPLLWALLGVALAANVISSVLTLPAVVGAAFGVLVLALGALLVRDHYRRRARR